MSQLPNQRCACGSGKKFKKCCMSKGMHNPTAEEIAEERLERRRMTRATHNLLNGLTGELAAMTAMLMTGPGFLRMQQDMEDRRALAELQATVDGLERGDTIDLDNLPPGVVVVRG